MFYLIRKENELIDVEVGWNFYEANEKILIIFVYFKANCVTRVYRVHITVEAMKGWGLNEVTEQEHFNSEGNEKNHSLFKWKKKL